MASGYVPSGVFLALLSCNQEVISGFSGELLRWETAEVAGKKRSRLNKLVRPPDLVDLCRVRHRRHLLHPLPQVRGRFVGSDGGPIYMLWCWRALAALAHRRPVLFFLSSGAKVVMGIGMGGDDKELGWRRRPRTNFWSYFSAKGALKSMARKASFLPESTGDCITSFVRPF
jgi:hypothetical protein